MTTLTLAVAETTAKHVLAGLHGVQPDAWSVETLARRILAEAPTVIERIDDHGLAPKEMPDELRVIWHITLQALEAAHEALWDPATKRFYRVAEPVNI